MQRYARGVDAGESTRARGRRWLAAILGGVAVLAGGAVLVAGIAGGLSPDVGPDDDAASPIPLESSNPGIGDSDGVPLDANGDPIGTVAVLVDFQRSDDATALRLTPTGRQCAFDLLDGDPVAYFAHGWAIVWLYGEFIVPVDPCSRGRSWAAWTLTPSYPDSSTRSTTVRISYGASGLPGSVVVSCGLDGDLDCVSGSSPFDATRDARVVVTVRVE